MIFISMDELIDKAGSIYKLTVLAARRAAELNQGATPLVDLPLATKPTTVALAEIRAGKVAYKISPEKDE